MLCPRARERRRPFPFFFHFSDVEESKVEGSRGKTGRQGDWRRENNNRPSRERLGYFRPDRR